ncbi:MAG: hypothetical protein IT340_12780 [Chloroflexi bacterium]|nr:hypothetical protein [Chloroflexota bacterium]
MSDRSGTAWLARFFRAPEVTSGGTSQARYTTIEVKAALRRPAADGRSRQIHHCLARIGMRVDDLSVRQRFRGLENYHQRLLRILTLYCRGWETDAIAAELSLFSTGAGVERAIDVAATLIAEQLNRQVAA